MAKITHKLKKTYKLGHQELCIASIDLQNEIIIGYSDLHLYPLSSDLTVINLNCQQCRVHRISINDVWEPKYEYFDPMINICHKDPSRHSIEFFESCHKAAISSVDPDNDKGEICILLPEDESFKNLLNDLKSFRVIVEFSLVKPKGGIKFVSPDEHSTGKEFHMFTCGFENSPRLWFPCIDSFSEICTWRLEFTVKANLTVVSCGDLIETTNSSDLNTKTFIYALNTPTSAKNIAVAVGPFEEWKDGNTSGVSYFCLPNMLEQLQQTTSFIHRVFNCFEKFLSTKFPYSCYRQVFVDDSYQDAVSYATLTICSLYLLHSNRMIDRSISTRKLLAKAVASQFYGGFVSARSWDDVWITKALSNLLCSVYQVETYGYNSYIYSVAKDMEAVCEHELNNGPMILDPSNNNGRAKCPFDLLSLHSEIFEMKCHLVMRMLEKRVGKVFMVQVMKRILHRASKSAQQKFSHKGWPFVSISTQSLIDHIQYVTGQDPTSFMNQWVYQGGVVFLDAQFTFNKRKNSLELKIEQCMSFEHCCIYEGPITIAVQEYEGPFNYNIVIGQNKTKFDFTCHSKNKRLKKRYPISTGEEIEMNLDDFDSDSPVLWLRIDPDMNLLRVIRLQQADFMWSQMLTYEKCVVSQLNAINALEEFATDKTRTVLIKSIENHKFFCLVRIDAAACLLEVENKLQTAGAGHILIEIFNKMFGCSYDSHMIKRNNFSNYQNYFIQKAFPLAISNSRNIHNVCPVDVLQFLLNLFKYNDNSKNKFSDCQYRASLVDSLMNTVTAALAVPVSNFQMTESSSCNKQLSSTGLIAQEIGINLIKEANQPSDRLVVTVSCLKGLSKLQKLGHLSGDPDFFKNYSMNWNFVNVRLAALDALIELVSDEENIEVLDWLLDVIENDSDSYLKFKILRMMKSKPPFYAKDNESGKMVLKEKLWNTMNLCLSHSHRLRCATADIYKSLVSEKEVVYKSIKEFVHNRPHLSATDYDIFQNFDDFKMKEVETSSLKRRAESPLDINRNVPMSANPSLKTDATNSNPSKIRIQSSKEDKLKDNFGGYLSDVESDDSLIDFESFGKKQKNDNEKTLNFEVQKTKNYQKYSRLSSSEED